MMQELVYLSAAALVLSAVLLFTLGHRLRHAHWLTSLLTCAAIAAGAWGLVHFAGAATLPAGLVIAGATLTGALVTAAFPHWNPAGHAALTASAAAVCCFLAYAVYVLLAARLGPWSLALGVVLLALQAAALALLVTHTYEIVDVVCRVRWRRLFGTREVSGYAPRVSLHVPTHDEPPELVIVTLDALSALVYPDYEVLVIDNNTADESMWRPVEEHCARLGSRFRFFHLMPWPGYKSGALNFALEQTDPEAEIVGVVDADYLVEPGYLRDLVGHFADPQVGFIQTPQDYRDVSERTRFGRAMYLAYQYFFKVSMASRNEHDAIIFAGTMGLLRRRPLLEIGGWDEWCITEDADVSLRLLERGFTSVYIDRTYGRGIMPLDYRGLKTQRFRWAFGGMQILRRHFRKLVLPARGSGLTLAQRFAYLSGGLQWLNDPITFAFTTLLLLSAGALLLGGSLYAQPLVGAVVFVPPLFILFAVMRFVWALRVRAGCRWRDALDAMAVLLGLTWVVTLACARGLSSKEGVFLRTPKQAGERPSLGEALRVVSWESGLALFSGLAAVALAATRPIELSTRSVVIGLLFWQSYVYGSALRTSLGNWREAQVLDPSRRPVSFPSAGYAVGRFLTERRLAVSMGLFAAVLGLVYFFAATRAPIAEQIFRANPRGDLITPGSVLAARDHDRVGAVLAKESEAVRRQDVERALDLWHPEGVIVDRAFTVADSSDDRVWRGIEELRARYEEELRERRYRALRHLAPRIEVRGDRAVLTNDLDAVIEDRFGDRRVKLLRSDRWEFREVDGEWKIVRLEVNRAPLRPPYAVEERL